MTLDSPTLWLEAASKAIVYTALLLALGACAVRWLLAPRVGDRSSDEGSGNERRLARLILGATAALTLGLAGRLVAHTAAAFGISDAWSGEALRIIGVESRWGAGWQLQMLGAVVALAGALLVKAHRGAGWVVATGAVVATALAMPLLGHAAGDAKRVAYHTIHVLGGGFWLGSLGSILLAARPRGPLLRRFAPIALTSAALLAASGTAMVLEYVSPPWDLWTTVYGRALATKLMLVGAAVLCGFFNWRRWRRAGAEGRPGRVEMLEAVLALCVVLVTALLTELEHS